MMAKEKQRKMPMIMRLQHPFSLSIILIINLIGLQPRLSAQILSQDYLTHNFIAQDTLWQDSVTVIYSTDTTTISKDTLWELPNPKCRRVQQIVYHFAYTVSFNSVWHIPNWVAYELTAGETDGLAERASTFKKDPKIIKGSADTKDYVKSGYDRGHMAPAADMRWSLQAMTESFYTSNICPQVHGLNAGDWKQLEDKGRDWANRYGNIFIACGPVMEDRYNTIGTTGVAVPKAFYKVIFRVVNGKYYGIGFLFSNLPQDHPLSYYAKSIDDIEKITGLDFFYYLPDNIENAMETQCRPADWY